MTIMFLAFYPGPDVMKPSRFMDLPTDVELIATMQKTNSLFITATDTSAGKTFTTALMLKFLRRHGRSPLVFKPVCCGGKEDLEFLQAASPEQTEAQMNGFYFDAVATPSVAAAVEGKSIAPDALLAWCRGRMEANKECPLLWEGAGGWMVPLEGNWCVADWAQALGFPVLLVVAERLGCLNHTLLTVRDLERRSIPLAGIILNRMPGGVEAAGDHRELLEKDFALPVWGRIQEGATELPQEIGEHLLAALPDFHFA
jgi:dethiobiotin synthetase